MPRINIEEFKKQQEDIKRGVQTCKKCGKERQLQFFNRQIKGERIYYKTKRCKICLSPKGNNVNINKTSLETIYKKPKTFSIKKDMILSPDAEKFIKRVVMMKGYIDTIEAFKLAHYHIETFGYVERLIVDIELELSTMFIELLKVYKK